MVVRSNSFTRYTARQFEQFPRDRQPLLTTHFTVARNLHFKCLLWSHTSLRRPFVAVQAMIPMTGLPSEMSTGRFSELKTSVCGSMPSR